MSDDRGRRCVTELLPETELRVYPVGRLDLNSEGLLLFTSDGKFANDMMHDLDPAGFDQFFRFPAGAHAAVCNNFLNSDFFQKYSS